MRSFLLTCCLLTALLGGCQDPQRPGASFDPFVVARPVNLARVLGPEVTLLGPEDTITLRTSFDNATGFTTISLPDSGGVLLMARAFKRRGLYYLLEPSPHDSGYWVHAVRIRRGQMQGLNTGYRQMAALAAAVRQGRWPELVRFSSSTGDSLRLRFEERALRTFYHSQLDSLPSYRLHYHKSGLQPQPIAELKARAPGASFTLYPNPAQTTATLQFEGAGAHTVQICSRGHVVRTFSAPSPTFIVPVHDLPNGIFFVRAQVAGSADRPATQRLVVAH